MKRGTPFRVGVASERLSGMYHWAPFTLTLTLTPPQCLTLTLTLTLTLALTIGSAYSSGF